MKKLICENDIAAFVKGAKTCIHIDGDTLITSAAADAAAAAGIAVTYGGCREGARGEAADEGGGRVGAKSEAGLDVEWIYEAVKQLADGGLLEGVVEGGGAARPYGFEKDPAGLKLVRGQTVKLDVLDTGDPANKAWYQEVIGSEESKVMNAGFLEIEDCVFDWEVQCDEMYYVIQGPIWITIEGKRYTAEAGDVVNLPVGHKIQIGAPGKARMFYGIKAA
jgi:ethanolamine utilization protein EutQ